MDEYLYLGYTVQQMAFSLFWISVPDQPHDVAHVLLLDGRVLVREGGKICEAPQHERARLPPACDAHRYAVQSLASCLLYAIILCGSGSPWTPLEVLGHARMLGAIVSCISDMYLQVCCTLQACGFPTQPTSTCLCHLFK